MNIVNVNKFNINGPILPGKYLQGPGRFDWDTFFFGADLIGADLVKGQIFYDS